jgi:hypothetical protein
MTLSLEGSVNFTESREEQLPKQELSRTSTEDGIMIDCKPVDAKAE